MYISWYHYHHHHPFMTFISKKRILNFAAGGTPQNKPKTFDRTTLAKQPVLSGSSSFQHLSTRSSSLWRRWEHQAPPKDWSVLLLTIFIKLLRGTFASSKGNLKNRGFWMTLDSFSCFYKGHTPLEPFALNMPRRPRNIIYIAYSKSKSQQNPNFNLSSFWLKPLMA